MPDTFFDIHCWRECKEVFRIVGLKDDYSLPPWDIDIKHNYELMTAINQDGVAQTMTTRSYKLQITEQLVNEALHLKEGSLSLSAHLTEKERNAISPSACQANTFKDLVLEEITLPLRLHPQYFSLGKPNHYTHLNTRNNTSLLKSLYSSEGQPCNFRK